MGFHYRNKLNQPIDYNAWLTLKQQEVEASQTITNGEFDITVKMRYFGTEGSVFKVWIECSSDNLKYYKYLKHFEGEQSAINDFNTVLHAVEHEEEVFDKYIETGLIGLIYDAMWDQHIVMDMRAYPELDYCYSLRSEAELKYAELAGSNG